MSDVLEITVPTGERVERDFTADELAQREADALEREQAEQEQAETDAAKDAAKASALAKLETLGLTTEEAQAIAGI